MRRTKKINIWEDHIIDRSQSLTEIKQVQTNEKSKCDFKERHERTTGYFLDSFRARCVCVCVCV